MFLIDKLREGYRSRWPPGNWGLQVEDGLGGWMPFVKLSPLSGEPHFAFMNSLKTKKRTLREPA
jgi:hypothetical protein